MRYLVMVALVTLGFVFTAAKIPTLTDEAQVTAQVKKELDQAIKDGYFDKVKKDFNLQGEFIFRITVEKTGLIRNVYVVSSDAEDVKQTNALKDQVTKFKFKFKVPKGKFIKAEYTFNF